MTTKKVTFSQRHPIYRCTECQRLTRLVNEMSDESDAEFHSMCITCWDKGTVEHEHMCWSQGEVEEHFRQDDCLECK